MRHFYPSYYEKFRCIAAACPDSCCQGWDVVIDADTEAYYQTVEGDLGERLREALYTDADGDRVFRLAEEKKCPFWAADKLCDIHRTLGEERLCETCARFPRLTMEYAAFTEHTLALACPEAARLILEGEDAYRDFTLTDAAGCEDYSAEEMTFLLKTRRDAAEILRGDLPLGDRLDQLLRHAAAAQEALTGESAYGMTYGAFLDLLTELDYIGEDHRAMIAACRGFQPDLSADEAALTRLSLYYIYRYLLAAVDTLDVLSAIQFAVYSVLTVAALAQRHGMTIAEAAQLYSKEIEQSYENMERLL